MIFFVSSKSSFLFFLFLLELFRWQLAVACAFPALKCVDPAFLILVLAFGDHPVSATLEVSERSYRLRDWRLKLFLLVCVASDPVSYHVNNSCQPGLVWNLVRHSSPCSL